MLFFIGCLRHCEAFRATSPTRLRTNDHYTLSTVIGGKGGAAPSSLNTTPWGINIVSECKMDVKSTWIDTWHQMDDGHLNYFQNPSLGGRLNTSSKTCALWTLIIVNLVHCMKGKSLKYHLVEAWSHMTSHYTWESLTTLCDFGSALRQPLYIFFWALTISWSRLLACMWWPLFYSMKLINFYGNERFRFVRMKLNNDCPMCAWLQAPTNHHESFKIFILQINLSLIYPFIFNNKLGWLLIDLTI